MENGSQIPGCGRVVYLVSLFVSLVSLVLQIVGLATRGWLILYYSIRDGSVEYEYELSMGLWSVKYCDNGQCETRSVSRYSDLLGYSLDEVDSSLDEYRAETIIGAIFMFVASAGVFVVVCRRMRNPTQGQTNTILLVAVAFCSCISALLAILAAGKCGKELADAHENLGPNSPVQVPYSIYITGVGGILAFIIAVILAIAAYSESKGTSTNQDQWIDMTGYQPASRPYIVQGNHPSWETSTNQGQRIDMIGYPPASRPYVVQGNHPRGYEAGKNSAISQPPVYYVSQ